MGGLAPIACRQQNNPAAVIILELPQAEAPGASRHSFNSSILPPSSGTHAPLKLSAIQLRDSPRHRTISLFQFATIYLQWTDLTISRSSSLLKRLRESETRSVLRDVRKSIDIATIIEVRGRLRDTIAVAMIGMIGTGAGKGTATEVGTIALGSMILTMMVTATSGLGTQEGTAKMSPKGAGTDIGTGTMPGTKSQASSHLRIRRRNYPRQTKRHLEMRPPWSGTPG